MKKQVDLAYMAGLFDGEGCAKWDVQSNGSIRVRLDLGITSWPGIVRVRQVLRDHGVVAGMYEQELPSGKTIFKLAAQERSQVIAWANLMIPHLTIKRDEVVAAREACVVLSTAGVSARQSVVQMLSEAIPPRYARRTKEA